MIVGCRHHLADPASLHRQLLSSPDEPGTSRASGQYLPSPVGCCCCPLVDPVPLNRTCRRPLATAAALWWTRCLCSVPAVGCWLLLLPSGGPGAPGPYLPSTAGCCCCPLVDPVLLGRTCCRPLAAAAALWWTRCPWPVPAVGCWLLLLPSGGPGALIRTCCRLDRTCRDCHLLLPSGDCARLLLAVPQPGWLSALVRPGSLDSHIWQAYNRRRLGTVGSLGLGLGLGRK